MSAAQILLAGLITGLALLTCYVGITVKRKSREGQSRVVQ
jgi:hypothetical protein